MALATWREANTAWKKILLNLYVNIVLLYTIREANLVLDTY